MRRFDLDPKGIRTPCPGCGAINRLAYAKLDAPARCARCHAEIPPPDAPIAVASVAAFDALVGAAKLPVLVDFWATWCPPCRAVAPELEKVARARAGRALVVKVDTEALPELSPRFGIRAIPTLVVFRGGREATRQPGAAPAATLEALIDAA